jgi:hypothetical protein
LGLSRSLIAYDQATEQLVAPARSGRVAVTSSRAALNGYQKGHCFYCFGAVQIEGGVDVDHFFPWSLRNIIGVLADGVWNLVLACPRCNPGPQGKFDLVPERLLLQRLHQRNEFLIGSHHPLRETLIAQTGVAVADRGPSCRLPMTQPSRLALDNGRRPMLKRRFSDVGGDYDRNAEAFFRDTVSADMAGLRSRFLTHIPPAGRLLDAGCGSGRDALAFHQAGYEVAAFDGSQEMVRLGARTKRFANNAPHV